MQKKQRKDMRLWNIRKPYAQSFSMLKIINLFLTLLKDISKWFSYNLYFSNTFSPTKE